MTYSIPPTRLIQVDLDATEIGRNYPVEVGVVGDVELVLRQLLSNLEGHEAEAQRRHGAWTDHLARLKGDWMEFLGEHRASDAMPIRPERVVADLNASVPRDAIILADVGVHHNWLVQQLDIGRDQLFLQAWGYAAMGFGVAGALGAQLAAPHRPVVAVCGDGGMLMTANAVATAAEYGLPVTWIVWNNFGYGSIHGQQAGFFGPGREIATRFRRNGTGELVSTDFAAMARSMGADGVTVERPEHLREHIVDAVRSGRPTLLDVRVDAAISPPATGSWDLPPLAAPPPNYPPQEHDTSSATGRMVTAE